MFYNLYCAMGNNTPQIVALIITPSGQREWKKLYWRQKIGLFVKIQERRVKADSELEIYSYSLYPVSFEKDVLAIVVFKKWKINKN